MDTRPRTALWRNLHAPGHDAAIVVPRDGGWQLSGTAVFRGDDGPVSVAYSVEADAAWIVRRGRIDGFCGGRRFEHGIERTSEGWILDGQPNGLSDLADLDFGFTPATNLQQLSRASLAIGERAEFAVAWFDIGRATLTGLPQIYERRDETHYWYESPGSGYQAMLETDPATGFVKVYPELWEMVA